MKVTRVSVGIYNTNCYIIEGDRDGNSFCIVVDPGDNCDLICSNITKPVTHIVLTHAHFDHFLALSSLRAVYPSALLCYCAYEDTSPEFLYSVASSCLGDEASSLVLPRADVLLPSGSSLCGFDVLWTPGHTHGSICLYSAADKMLFSGDTLFLHGFGRTDLGGSRHDMLASLKTLFTLPVDTVVYPGHGESTTIGLEKEYYHR